MKRPASCDTTNRREASREILGPRGSRGAAGDRPLAGDGDISKSSRFRPPREQGPDSTESPGCFAAPRQGVSAGECREPGGDRGVYRVRPGRQDEGPRRGGRRMRWGFRREAARPRTTSKGRAGRGQGPPRPAAGPPCPDRRRDRDHRPWTPPALKGVGSSAQRSMLTRGMRIVSTHPSPEGRGLSRYSGVVPFRDHGSVDWRPRRGLSTRHAPSVSRGQGLECLAAISMAPVITGAPCCWSVLGAYSA